MPLVEHSSRLRHTNQEFHAGAEGQQHVALGLRRMIHSRHQEYVPTHGLEVAVEPWTLVADSTREVVEDTEHAGSIDGSHCPPVGEEAGGGAASNDDEKEEAANNTHDGH